jgi:hypothetical protein
MMVRIKQNYKLIPEKSLVGLAVSQYDADTVGFVHIPYFVVQYIPDTSVSPDIRSRPNVPSTFKVHWAGASQHMPRQATNSSWT